jgi:hypothetical protein
MDGRGKQRSRDQVLLVSLPHHYRSCCVSSDKGFVSSALCSTIRSLPPEMSSSNNTSNSNSLSGGNLQGQLDLERDINKELLKKLEGMKSDKEEENEKYRILSLAFEELYHAHADLLKHQGPIFFLILFPFFIPSLDHLISNDLTLPLEKKNELLNDYDHDLELMKQIRSRSGLDTSALKTRGRRTSSLEGYLTGSALLRTTGGSGGAQV